MSKRHRVITSMVEGFTTIPWSELKTYEFNDLKEVEDKDVVKLKNAIVNDGFCFPIEVWAGHRYVIDGRGRDHALRALEADGFEIPDIPVVEIKAPSKEAAKRLVLMRSSQHGRLTQRSFDAFVSDIDISQLDTIISLPNIDIGLLDSDIGDDDRVEDDGSDDVEEYDEGMKTRFKCPKCSYEWD